MPDSEALARDLSDRYREFDLLGAGGAKSVFRAHDVLLKRPVAIASLHLSSSSPADLEEARAMAKVSDHARIVTIYDVRKVGAHLCLFMQYMDGGDLAQFLSAREALDYAQSRRIAIQLCESLQHIHRYGMIHCDIKPANVLLDASSDAYIADFGLTRFIDPSGSEDNPIGGTPAYLAPEVIRGATPDERSDIYSLGCVLYELLCGRPPILGDGTGEIITNQLHEVPPHPSALNPELPTKVADVIALSIEKNPLARPATVRAVKRAFVDSSAVAPAEVRWGAEPAKLVGRRTELRCLLHARNRAADGECELIVIEGEAGMGKSSLLEHLALHARRAGFLVASGRAHERTRLEFAPMMQALRCVRDPLSMHLASDSELLRHLDSAGVVDPSGSSSSASARTLYREIVGSLLAMSEHQKILLIQDDVHWADADSLDLIVEIVNLAKTSQISQHLIVAVGVRTGTSRSRRFGAWYKDIKSLEPTTVALQGLTPIEISELALQHKSRRIGERDLEELSAATGGNPMHVVQALAYGTLGGEGLAELIEERIETLTESCIELLSLISALSSPAELEVVEKLSGAVPEDFWDLVAEAEKARAINVENGSIEFSHPIIRTAVYAAIESSQRCRLHKRIADALGSVPSTGSSVVEKAHHLELSQHLCTPTELSEHSEAACRHAMDVGAWVHASHFAEVAIANGGHFTSRVKGQLHFNAAVALLYQQDVEAGLDHLRIAIDAFCDAGDLVGEARATGQLLASRTQHDFGSVDIDGASELATRLEGANRDAWARLRFNIADALLVRGEFDDALHTAEPLGDHVMRERPLEFKCAVENAVGGARLQLMQLDQAREHFSSSLSYARQTMIDQWVIYGLARLYRPHLLCGDLDAASSLIDEALRLCRRTQDLAPRLMALSGRIMIDTALGSIADAEERADEAMALLKRTQYAEMAGEIVFATAFIDHLCGRSTQALSRIEELLTPGALIPNPAPFRGIALLHKSLIERESPGYDSPEPSREILRLPRTSGDRCMDPLRYKRICLNVSLADPTEDTDVVLQCIRWLEWALDRKMTWSLGWFFSIPRALGDALAFVGRCSDAVKVLETALLESKDNATRLETALLQRSLANALARTGGLDNVQQSRGLLDAADQGLEALVASTLTI